MAMTTSSEARCYRKQHKAPCHDCPWRRASLRGWLGEASVDEWLAAAHSDALIHCHTRVDPQQQHWQCAGAAIYRANVLQVARRAGVVLQLPANKVTVFAWPKEFKQHHDDN